MEARVREELPGAPSSKEAGTWAYEPKWDGFRSLAWGGPEPRLDSRKSKPLLRYFPELLPLLDRLPGDAVIDGEIVHVRADGRTDFDTLSQRIHPAESRITMLARETPARMVAFDLLAAGGEDLRERPFTERRARLTRLWDELDLVDDWALTPSTTDHATAARWMVEYDSAGCDGIVAKRLDGPYVEGRREMVKVKLRRSIDCVVGGYRVHKEGDRVGSILLALYDADGGLHFVGHTSGFADEERVALLERLRPLEHERDEDSWGEDARRPDEPSRWNAAKPLETVALRPELVCQVSVDQFTGIRFRHAARFERWRPDKEPTPEDCPLEQIEPPPGPAFDDLLGEGPP
jgi:ATP-dependent DNA ligase